MNRCRNRCGPRSPSGPPTSTSTSTTSPSPTSSSERTLPRRSSPSRWPSRTRSGLSSWCSRRSRRSRRSSSGRRAWSPPRRRHRSSSPCRVGLHHQGGGRVRGGWPRLAGAGGLARPRRAAPHRGVHLPIPPHTSPYLPISPHISPALVELRRIEAQRHTPPPPSLRYHLPSAFSPPPPPPPLGHLPPSPPPRCRPAPSAGGQGHRRDSRPLAQRHLPTYRRRAEPAAQRGRWWAVSALVGGRLFPLQLASFLPPPPLLPALPSLPLRCRGYAGGQRTL